MSRIACSNIVYFYPPRNHIAYASKGILQSPTPLPKVAYSDIPLRSLRRPVLDKTPLQVHLRNEHVGAVATPSWGQLSRRALDSLVEC